MSGFVKKNIVLFAEKKSSEMSDNGGIVPPSSGGTSETPTTESSDATKGNLNLNEVLSFLRKNGLTGAEQLLSKQFSSSATAVGGSGPSGLVTNSILFC